VIVLDEDDILKRATKLLEQGCTMLAAHHTCGAPLFRCKGEIICPVCSFGGETEAAEPATSTAPQGQEREERGPAPQSDQVINPSPAPSVPTHLTSTSSLSSQLPSMSVVSAADEDLKDAEDALKRSIVRKLRELTEGIRDERDLSRLKGQLDCIEAAVKVLRSMGKP